MNLAIIGAVAVVVLGLRIWMRRRASRAGRPAARGGPVTWMFRLVTRSAAHERVRGAMGLVAMREVRERVRGRVFRVGTVIILMAVAAAVIIPTLTKSHESRQYVGVVGTLPLSLRAIMVESARAVGAKVSFSHEPSLSRADSELRSGALSLVVVDASQLVANQPIQATDTSATALFARTVSAAMGLSKGLEAAGVPAARAAQVASSPAVPIQSLEPAKHNSTARTTSLYGLILTYVLLTQYGTWLLMGVVEEKSSRVIEVLLSSLRPGQLLSGKVVGIGAVAFMQSSLIVLTALGLGAAFGSDLLHGSNPLEVLGIFMWLVLGYTFYCWVYAAGGSLADRQSQVQSLSFPLQLPILFGYIVSLTAISSGSASTLVKVLAYVPPTAPFAMPVLVALGKATWWEMVASVILMLGGIFVVVRIATTVYYRAILRTGGRVRLRQLVGEPSA